LLKAREIPKEQFKQEVEKELTGQETELWEIVYLKLHKSQRPVVEQAIETAALMLGTDKSRGYCLEMICADFLAGANVENENPEVLWQSALRFFNKQVLCRDGWRCQSCGTMSNLEVHHKKFRSHSGDDSEQNLITLCTACYTGVRRGRCLGTFPKVVLVRQMQLTAEPAQ